jgi:glucose-1-phosphate thymidylyltransferase
MKALILAAGYATRLYPLTRDYPKPLLKIGRRPIIEYIIDKLQAIEELDEIIVVTNSKFIRYFKEWARGLNTKKRISLVDDLTKDIEDRRGAIGDMDFAIRKKYNKDDLLVIGGDNLFDGGLKVFLNFATSKKNHLTIGVFNINDKDQAKNYGVVRLDKNNRILDFREKPKDPKTTLVAMCLYYFPQSKLKLIKEYLKDRNNKNDATGFYIDWVSKKEIVYGFVFDGRWYDIGHHKSYNEAKEKVF